LGRTQLMARANFLAIDIGASSGRLLLGKWNGSSFDLCELHRFPNESVSVNGSMHWDVLRLWHEIKQGIAGYASSDNTPLASIGIDTWAVDYGLLDKAGKLLGNPYHYRDHRTDGTIEKSFQVVSKADTYKRTGIQFMQFNTLYQLLSMVEARDPQLAHADTLLMIPDLINYWLSGAKLAEYTNASTTQLLNVKTKTWDKKLLQAFKIPDIFPEVVEPGTMIGQVQKSLANELGLATAPPIITTGSHDTASAVAAVPSLDDESVYISSGTWSLMGLELKTPIISEEALRHNFTNEGGVMGTIRFLKNVMGLWLLQESRRQWQREGKTYSWEELLELAQKAEPLASIIDPDASEFFSYGNMPEKIQNYCKQTGQRVPENVGAVVRCCLESLALRYSWVIETLESITGRSITTIRIVGGGSQNNLLNQFTANACNRSVVAGPVEATALGNIIMQAIAKGHICTLEEGRNAVAASIQQKTFEPKPHSSWDEAFMLFKNLCQD
jgi:rhamnulokinase